MGRRFFVTIFLVLLIICVLSVLIRFERIKIFSEKDENLSIISLSNKTKDTNELNFDLIYSAPHLSYVKSFNYNGNTNEFYENNKYEYTVNEYINTEEVELLLNNNLSKFKERHGQVNFFRIINNINLIVFDGWQLGEIDEGLIQYTILEIDNSQTKEYIINTNVNFVATNIIYYNDEYYIVGYEHEIINSEATYSLVLYNIHSNNKIQLFSTNGVINIYNVNLFNNNVITTYIDRNSDNYFITYDLEKNEVTNKINLSNITGSINLNIGYIISLDDMILCFYREDNNSIGLIKIGKDFGFISNQIINTSYYNTIKKIFSYQEYIYILIDNGYIANLNKYDMHTDELIELIRFEAINNLESIFLSDIVLLKD